MGYTPQGHKESDTTEHTHNNETVKISGAVPQTLVRCCQDMEGMPGRKPTLQLLGKTPLDAEKELPSWEPRGAAAGAGEGHASLWAAAPWTPHLIHRQVKSQQVAPTSGQDT